MPATQLATPQDILDQSEPPLKAGACVLRRPEAAAIVQNALLYFEAERYSLLAWCVMPNHVHAVFKPFHGYSLESLLHSWKSYTAVHVNRLFRNKGALWERESFNHLIRSVEDVERFMWYTEENPVLAGLVKTSREWAFSSKGIGFEPLVLDFDDPRTMPFSEPRSRGELPHLQKEGGVYFVTWRLLDAVELNRKS